MKQTETYNLKLIDRDDDFSPDALNDNAEAIDAALARVDGEFARVDEALATIPRIAFDTYKGNDSSPRKFSLPFTPKIVYVGNDTGIINTSSVTYGGLALEEKPSIFGAYKMVEIVEGGFLVYNNSASSTANSSSYNYRYFAIG